MTAQTINLTDFLLARIQEEEDAAGRTWPSDWIADGNTVTSRDPDPRESHLGDRTQVARLSMTVGKLQFEAANAEHIASHDPARVLAECEAKRRIVGMHIFWMEGGIERLSFAVKALACIHSDHPDFREEWRV